MELEETYQYAERNRQRFIEELRTLLRQPSVSAQKRGVRECAELLKKIMIEAGIETRVIPIEEGSPIVYGQVGSERSQRTLLVYDHYDVQPPEPIDEWTSDPFAAEIREGKITARGASDSKGNLLAYIKAVETFLKTRGDVPVSLKFLFEGEEEIGSPHLPGFVEGNKNMLKADAVVCCDGGLDPSGRPLVNLGLKGILYVELRCKGAKTDLHSSRAPLVVNPAWRLVWLLNTLKGVDERIAIEGWYDDVQPPTPEELKLVEDIPFDEEQLQREYGITGFLRDLHDTEALKALIYNPTCTVCGFESGYTGPGSKTVLPSRAMVKVDFRLVYDQNPDTLLEKLKRHLDKHGFGDVEVVKLGTLEPSKTPVTAPIARVVMGAAEEVYGAKPVVYPNAAGSGPDYLFTKRLGLGSVWTGCAPPFSHAHAPNEFITTDAFMMGIRYASAVIRGFGEY
ncbi:MAG: M20/M25/M40 family metallo-hydrolase [Candidatus Bathyarchaeia archaeon]